MRLLRTPPPTPRLPGRVEELMHSPLLRSLFVLFLVLSLATFSIAQSDRGAISGTITDPSGAVIPDATITATSQDTGETRTAKSEAEGNYRLPELKAGLWTLNVEAKGFKKAKTQAVRVKVQTNTPANVALEVGTEGQSVTVTADVPLIQTENAEQQSSVSERQVRELPLAVGSETAGRTPLSFIFLDSSVTAGARGTQGTNASNFRVNGGQGLGTEILIDGASTRRAQNGTFFSEVAPGPNAFQEFTLSTSNFSAEYGSTSGGVVNFTIKSGTNDYHGEAYDLMRSDKLNANSFFNNFN